MLIPLGFRLGKYFLLISEKAMFFTMFKIYHLIKDFILFPCKLPLSTLLIILLVMVQYLEVRVTYLNKSQPFLFLV